MILLRTIVAHLSPQLRTDCKTEASGMAAETRMKVQHFHKSTPPPEGQAVYEQITTSEMNVEGVYTTPDVTIIPTRCSVEKKEEQRGASKKKILSTMGIFVIASLAATACIVCIAVLFTEIATLKSHYDITIATMKSNYDTQLSDQQTKLDLLTDSLLNNSISHEAIVEDLFTLQTISSQLNESLYQLFDQQLNFFSCADLPPSTPSGYYLIRNSSLHVYCDMSRTCGGVTGGWMRVFELDMNITSHQCPNGLSQRTDGGLRTCVRNVSEAGCSSIFLPTKNMNYSRVCGRITGYQVGTTDGLHGPNINISDLYVDGVSLTHGLNPRQHIWTFGSAYNPTTCACRNTGSVQPIPSFVGNHYFCDSGNQHNGVEPVFHPDPLWDDDCYCCINPPWFYRKLSQPTSDDIEMRVCRGEANSNEDIAIQVLEIYVR